MNIKIKNNENVSLNTKQEKRIDLGFTEDRSAANKPVFESIKCFPTKKKIIGRMLPKNRGKKTLHNLK